jgi:hypothetical protein
MSAAITAHDLTTMQLKSRDAHRMLLLIIVYKIYSTRCNRAMSFKNARHLNIETVQLMTRAYDRALAQLGITPESPRSGELAAHIAQLADAGERDPATLCEAALRMMNSRSH